MVLTIHPHLAPRQKKEYSYSLLRLWAFVACSLSLCTPLWPRGCHAFFRHLMAVVIFIRRYPFDGKLGEPQIRQGRKSFFTPVENRTTIPRSSSPKPTHYTDRILVALSGRWQKPFFSKVSRQALVPKHPLFQWTPAAFRWKHRTPRMKLKTHFHIAKFKEALSLDLDGIYDFMV